MATEEEKQLVELQDRIMNGMQTLNRLQQQERVRTMQKRQQELMLEELQALPDSINMYKSVGKAYFYMPKPEIISQAESGIGAASTELESFKTQKTVLEQKMKEAENEMREMVKQNPAIIRQLGSARIS